MEHQWQRFIWWIGQNSAAVQALAAIITVILTAVLIFATIRYVALTRRTLEASEAALRASFLPDISARIDFTHPRRDELSVSLQNTGDPTIRIVRAKLTGGSLLKWVDPPNQLNQYSAEVKFGPRDVVSLASLFLRKNEEATANVQITPTEQMDGDSWAKFIDYRISLVATFVIEVSDITGPSTLLIQDTSEGSVSDN
jgi:hypothetical protein